MQHEYFWTQRWVPAFLEFIKHAKVPSKELVKPGPITLYGAQHMFMQELDKGLSEGQRFFVCLKARQLGISTFMLLLDIFWLYLFPGLQGGMVADTDENRIQFRQTITQVLDSLPPGFKIPVKVHNRAGLVLENGSRLQYMVAGKGKNPDLGRSRGLNFLHATELAVWGDQDGIKSLVDTLATENPNRLYIFESTAKGYNAFYDLHRDAKADPTQRAIFIGWWAKELYRIPAGTPEFERWWGSQPDLTEAEQAMAQLVFEDYGWSIDAQQWAWWRKQTFSRGEQNLLQEFPWHEKVAFQVTGSAFFSAKRIGQDMEVVRGGDVTFSGYRYTFGDSFLTMRCDPVHDIADADLRIWELPVKNARYAIGVDVAFGRNANNDRQAIEIYRCFADKLVQVAEWATPMPESRCVAWVMAHLAGSYRDCMVNLEVSGPGLTVMTELKYLRQQIAFQHLRPDLQPTFNARDALDQARWYLYHRPDTPGLGYMFGWKTNSDNKQEMMNGLRDEYSIEHLIIRSLPLLEEMKSIVQDGVAIQASGRNKDDRVFASGLACQTWRDWIRLNMIQENRTYALEMAKQAQITEQGGAVVDGIIPAFFRKAERERKDREFQRLLEG